MFLKFSIIFSILSGLLIADQNFVPNQNIVKRALKGEQVAVVKKIKKYTWPEVTIYDSLDSSPVEAMAIFTDYPLQKSYVPRLIKADIVKELSSIEKHVDFEMNLPFPAANSKYITGNVIGREGKGFIIKWYQVSSNSAKDSKGWARFIPVEGKTLLVYRSFVVPKSIFAGLFKKRVVKEVRRTIDSLKKFIQKLKTQSPQKVITLKKRLIEDLKNQP